MEFSYHTRLQAIEMMKSGVVDVLIIGGGITGAGIAREASLLGLKVALLERGDFASGTSSRSARMIHGGLRYLESLEFNLVFTACAERNRLYHLAPRLIHPVPFAYPIYGNSPLSVWKIRLGMWLYDLMATFRNFRRHRILDRQQITRLEPALSEQNLRGAAYYYDGLANDARLTMITIRSAQREGALVANDVEVKQVLQEQGHTVGVEAVDRITGEPFQVKAQVTVNATGVWMDRIRAMDSATAPRMVRANRGIHVIFPRARLPLNNAVVFKSADNQRGLYAVPWQNTCIVGTTDEDHGNDLENVYATAAEVKFILESVNAAMPRAHLTEQDILSTYAGLRPLIDEAGKPAYRVSRDHHIVESDSGLVSIAGGKYTTHRRMAKDLLKVILPRLQGHHRQVDTDHILLEPPLDVEAEIKQLSSAGHWDRAILEHLVEAYGADAVKVLEFATENPALKTRLVPDLSYIAAEIPYAIQYEMALALTDFLMRRTHIIYEDQAHGLNCMDRVADLMTQALEWSAAERERQLAEYRHQVDLVMAFRNDDPVRPE